MSHQREYMRRSDAAGRRRIMLINNIHSAVSTRSMTADNGRMVNDGVSGVSSKALTKYDKMNNSELMSELEVIKLRLKQQEAQIKLISRENSYLKVQLDKTEQYCIKMNLKKKEPINKLTYAPVTSVCESSSEDANETDESINQQVVEPKKHSISQNNEPPAMSSDPLEPYANKLHKTKKNSARPRNLGKMREFVLITEKGGYYTSLGDFDPTEDKDLCYTNRELKVPSWRVKLFSNGFTMDAVDICSETIAQTQYYSKCEKSEQKRKRWDLQRARELRQIDFLKEGRYKNSLQNSKNENAEQDVKTLLPNPDGIDVVRVTENLPVSAFGCNLYFKKNAKMYKNHYSRWCNDGSVPPQEDNEPEVTSLDSSQTQCKVQ